MKVFDSVEHGVFSSGESAGDKDTSKFLFAPSRAKNKKTAITRGLRN
jgi:hypothetical protein